MKIKSGKFAKFVNELVRELRNTIIDEDKDLQARQAAIDMDKQALGAKQELLSDVERVFVTLSGKSAGRKARKAKPVKARKTRKAVELQLVTDLPAEFSSESLVAFRKGRGLSRVSVAELMGVSPGTISNWEHGKATPSARSWAKAAERFAKAA